jgi:hypothetical protein
MRGNVQFDTKELSATITRAANTTAYASGDWLLGASNAVFEIGSNVNSDTLASETDDAVIARNSASRGYTLNNLRLITNHGTGFDGEIWLFKASPSSVVDNDPAVFTYADIRDHLVAVVEFVAADWYTNSTTAMYLEKDNLDKLRQYPELTTSLTGKLFAVIVARGAYTPVSAGVFTMKATFTRD